MATYVALTFFFPAELASIDGVAALQTLGFLALVASGLVFARRFSHREIFRNAAIWIGFGAAAFLIYSFRYDLAGVVARARSELVPAYAVSAASHTMTITASDDGGFYVMGKVNGAPVRFAIDTGANGVLLSPADAQRAGADLAALKFSSPSETANGVGYSAAYVADSFDIGPIRMTNVPVAVNRAPMSASLLGMAFLKRLDSFEFHGDQLTLKWRG